MCITNPIIDPEDSVAVAARTAIHTGDTASLMQLLHDNPDLVKSYIGNRTEARSLLHMLTDHPGNFPNGPETAKLLIEAGADVDAPFLGRAHSETPLHFAASCDDVAVLDVLIDAGANINAGGGVIAETPLADARAFLQFKAAKRLIERGAEVTLQDAATLGLLGRIKGLYESATHQPSQEDTDFALWNAAHGGQLDVVKFVHDKGAGVNTVPPWENLTPLDAAKRTGANDVIEWLEQNEANGFADL
ncbi:uncharacterized protein UV8b_00143 [Ustilaginoidea virens]|uniref:Uncharacterized protein n=1 Tax=Ustilaginoidea virens TaxID=1159556 RepID=A0A063C176_USTVR|nr:uncharacterized protein UV8b_00143 [Ustilaginoidea virens]QUC15902.1 hypothetical protein UV8b_00143 [Ustilaginoidea virens]GAO19798.1 hypothetical protein UVI_02064030 [Ustilaginoidea virens]